MKTCVIDYSKLYFSNIAKLHLPDRFSGKFVQIWHGDAEYLVFSPKDFKKYHANIVEYFSNEMNLAGTYNSEQKRFDIFEPEWKIIGGGKFEIDIKERFLRLYDDSMAYGRFNDKDLIERLSGTVEFSNYRIIIE